MNRTHVQRVEYLRLEKQKRENTINQIETLLETKRKSFEESKAELSTLEELIKERQEEFESETDEERKEEIDEEMGLVGSRMDAVQIKVYDLEKDFISTNDILERNRRKLDEILLELNNNNNQ